MVAGLCDGTMHDNYLGFNVECMPIDPYYAQVFVFAVLLSRVEHAAMHLPE